MAPDELGDVYVRLERLLAGIDLRGAESGPRERVDADHPRDALDRLGRALDARVAADPREGHR